MKEKNILEMVRKTILENDLIVKGDTVILGLSGGPDSLCLFYMLLKLSREINFNFRVIHVNHNLRGEDSDNDEAFVRKVTIEEDVQCDIFSFDCFALAKENGLSTEEEGRNLRHKAYEEVVLGLEEKGLNRKNIKIAVAHNMDDQVETVIFRLMRGSGMDGLGAMDYMTKTSKDITLIRPLIDVSRNIIESFCNSNNLGARYDKTNDENVYARNRIRNEVIPYIKKNFNPNIQSAILRLSKLAREDREYIWAKTEEIFKEVLVFKNNKKIVLQGTKMKNLPKPIRSRIIMKALRDLGLHKNISNVHLKQANELIEGGLTSTSCNLPSGYVLKMGYGKIDIYRLSDKGKKSTEGKKIEKPKLIIGIGGINEYADSPNQAVFDYDLFVKGNFGLSDPEYRIKIRTREAGDYIPLSGNSGNKKIQNLFVDEKIPASNREEIFMVTLGREVLWIPEGKMKSRYSGKYKLNKDTKKILVIKLQN